MASYRRSLRFLTLLIILLLIVTACVRPFSQSDEEAAQATAEAEVTTQAEEEAQPAEPTNEDADSTEAGEVVDDQEEEATTGDEEQEEAVEDTDEAVSESEESSSETVDENEAEETDADSSDEATDEDTTDEDAATNEDSSMDADSEATETAAETAPESGAGETVTSAVPAPLPAVHVVSKGENLFRIGLRYGLSWVPLAYYNNIPNPDLIYVGQNIYIPGGQAPPAQSKPESSSYTNYVVKRGDTLFRISRSFGVSPEEIVEANGIVNPNRIYAGQVLKIPTWTP